MTCEKGREKSSVSLERRLMGTNVEHVGRSRGHSSDQSSKQGFFQLLPCRRSWLLRRSYRVCQNIQ
jgi:hypothetical protein